MLRGYAPASTELFRDLAVSDAADDEALHADTVIRRRRAEQLAPVSSRYCSVRTR